MSRFTDALVAAATSAAGITTGAPRLPVTRTWAEVHADALRVAGELAAAGIVPGDAVAVLAAAPADIAPVVQGVWLAGGSVTMLHQPTARTDPAEFTAGLASVLRVVGARVVAVGAPFAAFGPLIAAAGVVVRTVPDLLAGDPPHTAPEVPEHLPALLQLTSGSTAAPKAVQITHANLWASLESMCTAAGLAPGDVMVSWLPMFHDMGMVGFLTLPMCRGIDLVSLTPADFLGSPLVWLETISTYRGTCTAAPDFAYALTARLLPRARGLDLRSLRFALNGAEPIDVAAVRAFLAAGRPFGLAATAMVCAYGMAEATLGVSFHPWGTPLEIDRIDAAALESAQLAVPLAGDDPSAAREFPVLGPPLPGIDVRVVDAGRVRGDREVGELQLRGAPVTDLYLTVDGPRPTRGADGWLATGDLGYLIAGRVVVCGRRKELIIMGGRNIYPTDIERAAQTVPGVRAGNAVAVRWTASGGRESFAVAVESRESGDPAAVARIRTAVRAAVTAAIGVRPAAVAVVAAGSIPKTPSGKIKRSAAVGLFDRVAAPG